MKLPKFNIETMKGLLIVIILFLSNLSYAQRTFSPYVPEVNPAVYERMLDRHDKDFKEMMQNRFDKIHNMFDRTSSMFMQIEDKPTRVKIGKEVNKLAQKYNAEEYDMSDDRIYKWLLKTLIAYQDQISGVLEQQ